MEEALGEILVIPFFGQGHLNPCMELCKHIASQNFKAIFIIPDNLSSSVPSTFDHHPFVEVVEIPNPSPSPSPEPTDGSGSGAYPPRHQHDLVQATDQSENQGGWGQARPEIESGSHPRGRRRRRPLVPGIESFLSERYTNSGQTRPGCVVIDVMMNWSRDIFRKLNIPIVSFFTSGACTSAMEYAKAKENVDDMKPGEIRILPGLPESMALTYADTKRQQRHRGDLNHGGRGRPDEPRSTIGPPGRRRFGRPNEPGSASGPPGPPELSIRSPWWEQAEGSRALLFNTSYDLDAAFLNYIANQIGKPVWGVGPMLPEQYWESSDSIVHDHEIRSNRESNVTEDEVLKWLDSKPTQSVIYISFGSEVGPTMEEFEELANALEESNRPFIWVIQPGSGIPGPPRSMLGQKAHSLAATEEGYYPHGLDEKLGERGLIIKGWAPQLLILSHPSVGGFLSHCGWNSTVEAIGRGVPILAWPIRGDQFYNAKLVVDHLKIGHTLLSDDPFATMKKGEIRRGVEMLMDDEEVHKRAMAIGDTFRHGFPANSVASLKAFIELVGEQLRRKQLGV